MKYSSKISLLFVAVWSVATSCAKNSHDVPHPHQGILKAYEPGPFEDLKLDSNDEKLLDSGKPVMKQTQGEDLGGGAICVQDVEAPKEAVWSQILDLDRYKGKVPKVAESKNYKVQENPDGTHTIKTKMVVGVIPGYSVSMVVLYSRCNNSGRQNDAFDSFSLAHNSFLPPFQMFLRTVFFVL